MENPETLVILNI